MVSFFFFFAQRMKHPCFHWVLNASLPCFIKTVRKAMHRSVCSSSLQMCSNQSWFLAATATGGVGLTQHHLDRSKSLSYCTTLKEKPDAFVESYSRIAIGYRDEVQKEDGKQNTCRSADIAWASEPEQADKMAVVQVNGNPVLEDRAIVQQLHTRSNGTLLFAAVIDGHGGWQVAEYVQRKLSGYIEQSINDASNENTTQQRSLTNEEIGEAMRNAFVRLDQDMMHKIKGTAVEMGLSRTAKVGACCSAVVITADALITANTGDCRIVLGTSSGSVQLLTSPHSANEAEERKRLQKEHPDEPDIVVCKRSYQVPNIPRRFIEYPIQWLGLLGHAVEHSSCYVKGRLQPTRSFGDFYLKKSEFAFDYENDSPFVRNAKSFPYITVSPDIRIYPRDNYCEKNQHLPSYLSSTQRKRSFLLLASDGVWDFLSPDQVCHLVSLEHYHSVSWGRLVPHWCSLDQAVEAVREGLQDDVQTAARTVIQKVLSVAAREAGLSIPDLALLPAKEKRRVYDDTTACLIMLDVI